MRAALSHFPPLKIVGLVSLLALIASPLRADWVRTETSLAWAQAQKTVWKFSFDPKAGKPFFHPLTIGGGQSLTNFKPEDHPWHYGLWFSWKYVNQVNYWEEDRASGRAEGTTRWTPPSIETHADGSATIEFDVSYTHPSGRIDVSEHRVIRVSAPSADGGYELIWRARFIAGSDGAWLDRTPMPDEPNGKFNGGYAGLALRFASAPLTFSAVSSLGPVTRYEQERSRPYAAAIGVTINDGATPVGGVAIVSDPANAGKDAPWYIVNSPQMRFVCAAILAPKPLHYPAGSSWELSYRIVLRPGSWTKESLDAVVAEARPLASKN